MKCYLQVLGIYSDLVYQQSDCIIIHNSPYCFFRSHMSTGVKAESRRAAINIKRWLNTHTQLNYRPNLLIKENTLDIHLVKYVRYSFSNMHSSYGHLVKYKANDFSRLCQETNLA